MSKLGDLNFEVYYKGVYMGTMISPDTHVKQGDNFLNMTGIIKPKDPSLPLVTEALSLVLAGKPLILTSVGDPKTASSVPLFAPGFANLSISSEVSIPAVNLMPGALMHSNPLAIVAGYIPTNLLCHNPFGTTMSIVGYDTKVFRDGAQIGYAKDQFPDDPIILPPLSNTTTREIKIYFTITADTVAAMFKSLTSESIILTMTGNISTIIGSGPGQFSAGVYYEANHIESKLKILGDR